MDRLWSPWRYSYVVGDAQPQGCVFCERAASDAAHDREHLILRRGSWCFVLLNLYPYTTGHAMVAPYAHGGRLRDADPHALKEMMEMAQQLEAALETLYHPEGYNLGLNLGKSAGAGVADHLHLHLLPRWTGDTSFMTVVGETRVLPEDLLTTYDKLLSVLGR